MVLSTGGDPLDRAQEALEAVDRTTAFIGSYGMPTNQVDPNKLFVAQYYLREAIAALAEELRAQRAAQAGASAEDNAGTA